MILAAVLIWGILVLLTPAFLLRIYSLSESSVVRLIISLLIYVFITIFTFLVFILLTVGAEPRRNSVIPITVKLMCFILVLFYAVCGWILGGVINRRPITSLDFMNLNKEKPQSIFNSR